MNYNLNSGYGAALAAALHGTIPTFGRIFVVFASGDAGEERYNRVQQMFTPDPDGQVRFFTSLETAIDNIDSNNNDVILLDADGTHSLSAGVTMSSGRVNFIGMDGGGRSLQQGAKIASSSSDTTAFVWKNTGTRNSYRNIKWIQNSTNAAALTVYQEGGEGTFVENCSATFGVADNLDQTTAHEIVMGGDSCTYKNFTFGQDTLLTSAARSVMIIDQVTSGQECKSNVLIDCTWVVSSSDAGAQAISMAAATDILFTNHFIRPSFIASLDSAGGAACTRAVSTANGTTKGTVLISYPMCHGFTDLGTNGTNNDNLRVVAPLVSNTDLVGVAPIAT